MIPGIPGLGFQNIAQPIAERRLGVEDDLTEETLAILSR